MEKLVTDGRILVDLYNGKCTNRDGTTLGGHHGGSSLVEKGEVGHGEMDDDVSKT
jgi:hypothetical protein